MVHKGTKTITTSRLILRKFTVDDAQMMFNNWANDERVTKFLSWTPHKNIEGTKQCLQIWTNSYSNNNFYHWAIENDGQVIGSIGAVSVDEKNHLCEIGYCIGYDYWGKGITTEAMLAIIGFLFIEVGFHRIFAKHDVENPNSGKVMKKCGMIYEGRMRGHYLRHDGTYSDSIIYGIIIDDYQKVP